MPRLSLAILGLAALWTSAVLAGDVLTLRTNVEPMRSACSSHGAVEIRLADLGMRIDT